MCSALARQLADHGDGPYGRADDPVWLANRERWIADGWYGRGTLADLFRAGAQHRPEAELVVASNGRVTVSQLGDLHARSTVVASALRKLGVGPGDVVATILSNSEEAVVALGAIVAMGAVILPLGVKLGPQEIHYVLKESEASTVILPSVTSLGTEADLLAAIGLLDTLQRVVVVGGEPTVEGGIPWADLESGSVDQTWRQDVSADDPCLLIYTSGTTSSPKGVIHTHNSLMAELASPAQIKSDERDSTFMGCFPAGHLAGFLGQCRLYVSHRRVVLLDGWDAQTAAQLVERYGVTHSQGSPLFLRDILDAAALGANVSSLRAYRVSATAIPVPLLERADALGITTYRLYGLTEHPTVSSGSIYDRSVRRLTTDGKLLPGIELRITAADGSDASPGESGEITTRGPDQFIGYLNPRDNEAAFQDGWFHTGDLGSLDADGYLTVTGRKKDIIIRGGENISSGEVEEVMLRHPAVQEVAVVPYPDERYGERVAAFVVLHDGAELNLSELVAHFRALGVSIRKTPERLEIVDQLPYTSSGKVQKHQLAAMLSSGGVVS